MLVFYFLSAAKESSKESRAAYENVTFSNGGGQGRPSLGGLKLHDFDDGCGVKKKSLLVKFCGGIFFRGERQLAEKPSNATDGGC